MFLINVISRFEIKRTIFVGTKKTSELMITKRSRGKLINRAAPSTSGVVGR